MNGIWRSEMQITAHVYLNPFPVGQNEVEVSHSLELELLFGQGDSVYQPLPEQVTTWNKL